MDRETAGVVAQLVPVLLLSLLFEARLKPGTKRTALGLLLGFAGNLFVAVTAIVLEFGLLGTLQHPSGSSDASWMWALLAMLFAIVLIRWAVSTTAMKIAASSTILRDVMSGVLQTFSGVSSELALALRVLSAPSEVLAVALRTVGEVLVGSNGVFRSTGAVLGDAGRTLVRMFRGR